MDTVSTCNGRLGDKRGVWEYGMVFRPVQNQNDRSRWLIDDAHSAKVVPTQRRAAQWGEWPVSLDKTRKVNVSL
jgi:hypothetical protein